MPVFVAKIKIISQAADSIYIHQSEDFIGFIGLIPIIGIGDLVIKHVVVSPPIQYARYEEINPPVEFPMVHIVISSSLNHEP